MIRDPLDACSIAGVLVIGRLFLSHVTCGLGSPSTAQLRTARSPSVSVVSVGVRCILGGTARGSNTKNGSSEMLNIFALIVLLLFLPYDVLLRHNGKFFVAGFPQECHNSGLLEIVWYRKLGHQYSAGTRFSAPQSITEKPMEVYYLDE